MYLLLILLQLQFFGDVYSFQFQTANGSTVNTQDFQGKYILFVNFGTNSSRISQLASLEQLYQLHKDSLVVVAFPSNSFGNEPNTNQQLYQSLTAQFDISYIIGEKVDVAGAAKSPIYQWLTEKSSNGIFSNEVKSDFYKFLVTKNGQVKGVFGPTIDPMSDLILTAMKN